MSAASVLTSFRDKMMYFCYCARKIRTQENIYFIIDVLFNGLKFARVAPFAGMSSGMLRIINMYFLKSDFLWKFRLNYVMLD